MKFPFFSFRFSGLFIFYEKFLKIIILKLKHQCFELTIFLVEFLTNLQTFYVRKMHFFRKKTYNVAFVMFFSIGRSVFALIETSRPRIQKKNQLACYYLIFMTVKGPSVRLLSLHIYV